MYDALIVGGSFAGLSAATYIARARRTVLLIDAGEPRNRFASASHGFLTRDGDSPQAMLETARAQLAAYPTVTFVSGHAAQAAAIAEGFSVTLEDGRTFEGRKLLLATGVRDMLPDIPGFRERWGRSIGHCPYCHGYEIGKAPIAVRASGPMAAHYALLVSEWGPVTLLTDGFEGLTPEDKARLDAKTIRVETTPIRALRGEGTDLSAIVLADGREIAASAMLAGVPYEPASDLAARLGCAHDDSPMGLILRIDDMGQTTVPGVYAAGDITHMRHSVGHAVASGITAGTSLHQSLVFA